MRARASADLDRATLVIRGGAVYTSRPDGAVAEAVAIGGDRILAVGSRATIDGYIGPQTRIVDLRGGMLLPGFIDTHTHFASGSIMRTQVDLDDAMDPNEVARRLAAYARAHPNETWILGGNWQYDAFPPTGLPDKALLDRVVADRPVMLDAFDGHSVWANSKAMQLAGITRETAMVTVLVTSRTVEHFAMSAYDIVLARPLSARTARMAAVSVVLPWSMCPIVPTLTCGFVRSNFFLAIGADRSVCFGGAPWRRVLI